MPEDKNNNLTTSISFRIKSKLADRLRNHAELQQIGLNTLVSQIFTQYLDWYQNAGKAGFSSAPKILLTAILEKYTKQELDKFAKDLVDAAFVETHMILQGEVSPKAVFAIIESWARSSYYHYQYEQNEKTRTMFIQHDLGPNWSYLLSKIWELIFQQLGAMKWKSEITARSVRFSVELPDSK